MRSISELGNRSGEAATSVRTAPVIIVGYTGSGADQLLSALSAFPELARTRQTGILPLCHQAVGAWQVVDDRGGDGLSPLAAVSVRALYGGLVAAVLAREGGSRWCEFTSAPLAAMRTFTRLYPGARFLSVHRRAETAISAIIGSGRWGLEGQEFAPFVSVHPASPVAALASYWAVHTAQQLEFEQENPEACHRVPVEDLTRNGTQILPKIGDFLALDDTSVSPSFTPDHEPASTGLPLDRIPVPLLVQVNDLHRRLGYSPVTNAGRDT